MSTEDMETETAVGNRPYRITYYRDFTKPWKRDPHKGAYTNAARPQYPKVFRPYGNNTRDRVVGFRKYTRMHHLGYDAEVVESRPVPPCVPDPITASLQPAVDEWRSWQEWWGSTIQPCLAFWQHCYHHWIAPMGFREDVVSGGFSTAGHSLSESTPHHRLLTTTHL